MVGEYMARWGSEKHVGKCIEPANGCHKTATWSASTSTYTRELELKGMGNGLVWADANYYAHIEELKVQRYKKGMKSTIYLSAFDRPLDLVASDMKESPRDPQGRT